MPRDRTRRRAEGREQTLPTALGAPFRQPANPWPPLDVLPPESLERIHLASMRILEEVGLEFLDDEALGLWARAGARVDRAARRVWIDRGLLLEAVGRAPAEFTLHARNPERDVVVGGNRIVFSPVGGPAYSTNLERGRRPGTLADYEDLIRLTQVFNGLHNTSEGHVEPVDLPAETRHLDGMYRLIRLTDKTLMGPARGRELTADAIEMAALVHGGRERLCQRPALLTVINVNSPLRYDDWMLGGLLTYAYAGQPVVITPFILAGAMGPITIAGAMAQQNAEALAGVALTQLARPGVPVVYGGFTTDTHMRSGNPSFGTPEGAWATLAGGQLARRYQLPYRCSGGLTSSNVPDAQAAYETMMSLWTSVLAHGNFIYHAAGWVEGGLGASYEKFILDMEALALMTALLAGFPVDEATLALESIAAVGPGGHHFDTPLTLERYNRAFYEPLVNIRQAHEAWQAGGGLEAHQRAHRKWKELLAGYQEPPLDPAVDEALREFVERRKREITKE
jgi:trimethylamine--corrinoid protein Co-methyltransferase